MLKTFVYFFLTSLIIHTGHSLNCYVCNSAAQSACNDPFDTSIVQLQECNLVATGDLKPYCYKMVTSVNLGDAGSVTTTARDCTLAPPRDDQCSVLSNEITASAQGLINVDSCVICESDSCNGQSTTGGNGSGPSVSYSGMFLIIVPSLAFIMTSYFSV